jgi:hypothetical protein
MRVEVEGTVAGAPAKVVWQDGWYAGTFSALTQLTLISELDGLELDDRDGFVLAALRVFEGHADLRVD